MANWGGPWPHSWPLRPNAVIIIRDGWKWRIRCRYTGWDALALYFRTKKAAEAWLAEQAEQAVAGAPKRRKEK
jgi:hypothetical protein